MKNMKAMITRNQCKNAKNNVCWDFGHIYICNTALQLETARTSVPVTAVVPLPSEATHESLHILWGRYCSLINFRVRGRPPGTAVAHNSLIGQIMSVVYLRSISLPTIKPAENKNRPPRIDTNQTREGLYNIRSGRRSNSVGGCPRPTLW